MKIRTLILDHEPAARRALRALLAAEPDVEILAETSPAALPAAAAPRADLIFLEAGDQGVATLTALADLTADRAPAIVIMARTASHALAAFDAGAVDYLLKPFQPGRLHRTLERVREHLQARSLSRLSPAHRRLLADLEDGPQYWARIPVRDRDRMFFVPVEELIWAEAEDNYVLLHTARGNHLVRLTLNALEAALNPEDFCRISRSTLLNLAHLAELRPLFKGRHVAVLRDGTRLTVTRSVNELERLLKFS